MNSVLPQFQKLWSDLGSNQKLSILVAATSVVVGMVVLLIWAGRPQMKLLYGRLSQEDMGSVVAYLDENSIPYELRGNGTSIYTLPEHVFTARMQMAADGIPSGGGVGFEIFDKGNFGISDFVQRTNYLRAVQGELARTISQLRGVKSSRVMIVVPENRLLLDRTKNQATASVFVETGGGALNDEAINSIRFLVANAVEGLEINDVAVVDNNGNVLSERVRSDETLGLASSQLRYRKSLENYFSEKIETLLSPVVGAGGVVARVAVDVSTEASTTIEETYDPEGQVVRSQTSNEDASSRTETRPSRTVGVAANVPDGGANDASVGRSDTNENSKNRTITYEINKQVREVVRRPGDVDRLTAAVFIARRPAPDGAEAPAPRSEDEIQRLVQMVSNAIGVDSIVGDGVTPSVSIEEVDFVSSPLSGGIIPEVQDPMLKYLDVGRNFISVGIAVVMFIVFMRMLKKHRNEPINVEVVEEPSFSSSDAEDKELAARPTPELLNELIQQKPENVGTALKQWMIDPNSATNANNAN